MSEPSNSADAAEEDVRRAIATLSREERMLVVVNRQLYDGDWDELIADLQAHLHGGVYIFKLATRIEDDLERIDRLRAIEQRLSASLGDYITE